MILPCMDLSNNAADAGFVGSYQNEQVLAIEAHYCTLIDYLDMRQVLTIGADFILALDYQHAPVS